MESSPQSTRPRGETTEQLPFTADELEVLLSPACVVLSLFYTSTHMRHPCSVQVLQQATPDAGQEEVPSINACPKQLRSSYHACRMTNQRTPRKCALHPLDGFPMLASGRRREAPEPVAGKKGVLMHSIGRTYAHHKTLFCV